MAVRIHEVGGGATFEAGEGIDGADVVVPHGRRAVHAHRFEAARHGRVAFALPRAAVLLSTELEVGGRVELLYNRERCQLGSGTRHHKAAHPSRSRRAEL